MADEPVEVKDTVPEKTPDTIATPEGDNEFGAEQVLPKNVPPITRPRGDEPHSKEPLRDAES